MLKESLIRDGQIVSSYHFPSYNTYQGISVERYLNGDYGTIKELSPYFVNNLYANDRAITWYTQ